MSETTISETFLHLLHNAINDKIKLYKLEQENNLNNNELLTNLITERVIILLKGTEFRIM
jgi:hypothetical protein